MSPHLSKSDFKTGISCAKKLVYKKMKYPTSLSGNEYMQMLADGGYLIGKYATLHYPDGIEMPDDFKLSEIKTAELLASEVNVTLFEATIIYQQKVARIDILVKKGNVVNLIEVKSKSFDSEKGNLKKDLSAELADVAFQKLVLQDAYPNSTVNCFLLVPDKSKRLLIEDLITWFNVKEPNPSEVSNFKKPNVEFIFDNNSKQHKALIENSFLTLVDGNTAVEAILLNVKSQSKNLVDILNQGIKREDYELTTQCFSCEYRTPAEQKNGFKECWGKLADVDSSISTLYHIGTLGGKNKIANQLIRNGTVAFSDLKPQFFYKSNSTELGNRGIRQMIQYENTLNGTEWFSQSMKNELDSWQYPLHFIDFETYTGAMPHHKGMRPYETVAFQWSCHTVSSPDATPIHSEWINTEHTFPNFRFAESLMKQIGINGTPLMWATHENTVLRSILNQMDDFDYENQELRNWLLGITKDEGRAGRLET